MLTGGSGGQGILYYAEVTDDDKIEIKDGRHPVVEKIIGQEAFVPMIPILTWMKTKLLKLPGLIWRVSRHICGRWR